MGAGASKTGPDDNVLQDQLRATNEELQRVRSELERAESQRLEAKAQLEKLDDEHQKLVRQASQTSLTTASTTGENSNSPSAASTPKMLSPSSSGVTGQAVVPPAAAAASPRPTPTPTPRPIPSPSPEVSRIKPQGDLDVPATAEFDIFVICAPSGRSVAKAIEEILENTLFVSPEGAPPASEAAHGTFTSLIEQKMAGCKRVLGILSKDCLLDWPFVFALRAAVVYKKNIVLLHDIQSCPMPAQASIPPDLVQARVFIDRPVPFISQFADRCIQLLAPKLFPAAQKPGAATQSDKKPEVFLSYRRLSAAPLAARLQADLKTIVKLNDGYNLYPEAEADLGVGDLARLFEGVRWFVAILSDGYLDSEWCLREIRAAIQHAIPIVLVRDFHYDLPDELPTELQDLHDVLHKPNTLQYHEDFYPELLTALKTELGPPRSLLERLDAGIDRVLLGRVTAGDESLLSLNCESISFDGVLADFVMLITQMLPVKRFAESAKQLTLTKCALTPDDYRILFEHLPDFVVLDTLEIYDSMLAIEAVDQLAASLKKPSTSLAHLKLRGNNLQDVGVAHLAECLRQNRKLRTLCLDEHKIRERGAQSIAEALKGNKTLTALLLPNNLISWEGAEALAKALASSATLKVIDLDRDRLRVNSTREIAGIGAEGAVAFAGFLKSNSSLASLNLGVNSIEDRGAVALADSLRLNSTLVSLGLDYNGIKDSGRDNGCSALADALKGNATLLSLSLQGNSIKLEGAGQLGLMMKINTSLESLNLSRNFLKDDGVAVLCDALRINPPLTTLGLAGNSIGDKGAQALADMLRENIYLTSLNLTGNQIKAPGVAALCHSLKLNSRLGFFGFSQNPAGPEAGAEMAEVLQVNIGIHTLSYPDGAEAISEALKANKTLTSLTFDKGSLLPDALKILEDNRQEALRRNPDLFKPPAHDFSASNSAAIQSPPDPSVDWVKEWYSFSKLARPASQVNNAAVGILSRNASTGGSSRQLQPIRK